MATGKSADTPFLGGPDTLEITRVEHPFRFRGGDEGLNARIVEAINRMGAVGDDADRSYQEAIETLQKQADEALRVIAGAYEAMPEESYLDRWSLIYLAAELRRPAAFAFLDDVVGSTIPDERYPDAHDVSTTTEEVILRTTAVEGIVRLAAAGVEEARAALLRHLRHPQLSVRRACVQGLVETGSDRDHRELRALLAETGEERLLEIRRLDVREVPQATGGQFVVPSDVKDEVPVHDLGTGRREG
jgi:hypothetical protein